MPLGFFDLPAPLLTWLDQQMAAFLPAAGRLVVWGVTAAVLSMALYTLLSPQRRLKRVRTQAVEARRALDRFDGSFAEARPLMAAMFTSSSKQLAMVFTPAVIASLPLLFLLVWLYGAFGYVLPSSAGGVGFRTQPAGYLAAVQPSVAPDSFQPGSEAMPSLVVHDAGGRVVDERPLSAPVTVLHKKKWWNLLISNPLGYLAPDSPLDLVEIDLPRREVLPFGPWWLRTWEFVFFTTLVVVSLAIKLLFRVV
jgi:hypothetical protein